MKHHDHATIAATSSGEEWMPSTRTGRLLAITLVVVTVLLIAAFILFLLPLLRASFDETATAIALPPLRNAMGFVACVGIGCGIYLCLYGRAILRRGHCPPSGTLVWRKTRIVRGSAARRVGLGSLATGLIAILFCAAMLLYFNHLIDRMTPPQPEIGVIVEPQPKPAPR